MTQEDIEGKQLLTIFELLNKYDRLKNTFEEILVEQFAISELRDFWRKRAGLSGKCEET